MQTWIISSIRGFKPFLRTGRPFLQESLALLPDESRKLVIEEFINTRVLRILEPGFYPRFAGGAGRSGKGYYQSRGASAGFTLRRRFSGYARQNLKRRFEEYVNEITRGKESGKVRIVLESSDGLFDKDGQMVEKSSQSLMFDSEKNHSVKESPVECLGMTFQDDEERRNYFLEKLREKLQDPEFRKIEGFPIGSDEDILALSDPPYYLPVLTRLLKILSAAMESLLDPKVPYSREPFAADVSEGRE
jgi:hypothetical protein